MCASIRIHIERQTPTLPTIRLCCVESVDAHVHQTNTHSLDTMRGVPDGTAWVCVSVSYIGICTHYSRCSISIYQHSWSAILGHSILTRSPQHPSWTGHYSFVAFAAAFDIGPKTIESRAQNRHSIESIIAECAQTFKIANINSGTLRYAPGKLCFRSAVFVEKIINTFSVRGREHHTETGIGSVRVGQSLEICHRNVLVYKRGRLPERCGRTRMIAKPQNIGKQTIDWSIC